MQITSFFLNFLMVLETHIHMKLPVTEWDFAEEYFLLQKLEKNWESGPKIGQKHSFFNLLKNLVFNFYGICFIMKNRLIYCVSTQIPYLGTLLFQRHGRKCSQLMALPDFLINHISRTNQWNSLPFCMLIQIHKE